MIILKKPLNGKSLENTPTVTLLYKDERLKKKHFLENMTGGYYGVCANEFHHIKSLKVVTPLHYL